MKWIKNYNDLNMICNNYSQYACEEAAELVQDKIQEFIDEYYNEYTPHGGYIRVFNFLNSVVKEEPVWTGRGWATIVYIDPTIEYNADTTTPGWTTNDTAEMANEGYHGNVNIPSKHHFFDEAYDEILDEKHLTAEFKKFLEETGVQVEYKRL